MPGWVVKAAYGLTWVYVTVDVAFHTEQAYSAGKSNEIIARTCVHSAVFQAIASVALPAFIIHQARHPRAFALTVNLTLTLNLTLNPLLTCTRNLILTLSLIFAQLLRQPSSVPLPSPVPLTYPLPLNHNVNLP